LRVYCHYCRTSFSNCYIVGEEASDSAERVAIVIDPGEMDLKLLNYIEENNFTVKGVFVTHDHANHVNGLATLLRIYDVSIYAINPTINEFRCTLVRDGETVTIGSLSIDIIAVPGHSIDSAVFKIGSLLFTGDTLTAGLIGKTISSYSTVTQVNALRRKILSLPGDYAIFPGAGPPTSLNAERRFNFGIQAFDDQKKHRKVFRVDL